MKRTPLKRGRLVRKGIKPHILRKKRTTGRIKPNKTKVKSISKLIKECDRLFSIQIRTWGDFEREGESWNSCFTCQRQYPIKKLHNGHYLSRYYKAARWHEDNARPQCMMCNMWKRGDPVVFRRNLITEIGEARVLAVEALRDAPIKLSREFLEAKIKELSTTPPIDTL